MFSIFIAHPLLAFVVTSGMFGLYLWRRSRVSLIAGGFWVLYGIWEYLMQTRVLCSGKCNIRVDLLLLYPVLAAITTAALLSSFLRRPRAER